LTIIVLFARPDLMKFWSVLFVGGLILVINGGAEAAELTLDPTSNLNHSQTSVEESKKDEPAPKKFHGTFTASYAMPSYSHYKVTAISKAMGNSSMTSHVPVAAEAGFYWAVSR